MRYICCNNLSPGDPGRDKVQDTGTRSQGTTLAQWCVTICLHQPRTSLNILICHKWTFHLCNGPKSKWNCFIPYVPTFLLMGLKNNEVVGTLVGMIHEMQKNHRKIKWKSFSYFTECKTSSFKNQRNTEVKCMWLGVVHRCVYLLNSNNLRIIIIGNWWSVISHQKCSLHPSIPSPPLPPSSHEYWKSSILLLYH